MGQHPPEKENPARKSCNCLPSNFAALSLQKPPSEPRLPQAVGWLWNWFLKPALLLSRLPITGWTAPITPLIPPYEAHALRSFLSRDLCGHPCARNRSLSGKYAGKAQHLVHHGR